ncbi:MAG: PAS domain-containing protein [Gammaproteobacteria bacterium]
MAATHQTEFPTTPTVDRDLEALGHYAFEWQANRGWWFSPGARTLLGLAPAPVFVDDESWWSCVQAGDRAKTRAALDNAVAGVACDIRFTARISRGPVHLRALVVTRGAGGRVSHLRGTLTAFDADGPAATGRAGRHEVDALGDAHIAWYEREGRVIRGSPSIAEIYDFDEPEGPWDIATAYRRLPPFERERHQHELEIARTAADALSATHVSSYRVNHRDGGYRDIEIHYRIENAGEPLRTYGLILDVTATKALEAKYQDAMDDAGVAWFERDIASDVLTGSRSLWRLYGIDPAQQPLRFASLVDCIHPDDWQNHPAHGATLGAQSRALGGRAGAGPAGTVRYRVRREDDDWRWIEVRYVVRYDGRGGGTTNGLVFDVTDAQQAKEELRAGHQRLLLALEAARMATWEWDVASGLISSNDVLKELYGLTDRGPWPLAELVHLVHPDDRPRLERELTELRAGPRDEMLSTEFRLQRPDGATRWFEVRARDDGNRLIGVSADVTARKLGEASAERLRRQLQQAQKMEAIGQLTGGIAHDFNNILASVLGYAELALKRYGDRMPERLFTYIGEMQAGGRRARDLVSQLLAFSRDEGGTPVPIALDDSVAQSIRMLRPTLPASMVITVHPVATDLPQVMADPVQLQQVVMNLCINARDAMGGSGQLDVSLAHLPVAAARCASCQQPADGDFVVLSLSDDGPGIAPESQTRIFEPFYTTKAFGQGTGMGLAMVHGIVHRLGGHILLESALGRGATFGILLPVAAASAAVATLPAPTTSPMGGHGTILVIDDEAAVAHCVAEQLRVEGYRVDVESDPRRALADLLAGRRTADLVLCDQTMPGLSGAELSARLHEARPQLPIILMTGYSATLDADVAGAAGACALLAKPVAGTRLLTTLRAALRR